MKKKLVRVSVILFCSVALWVAVSLSDVFITTIRVPVHFTELPKYYALGYSSVREVDIEVKGRGWDLAKLVLGSAENFDISVHKRTGRRRYELNDLLKTNTWLTSSLQVLEISPSFIEYEVERVGSKRVGLIKNFKIEFKPGYGPSSVVKTTPGEVEIYGPAYLLQKIDSLKTESGELFDVAENVMMELNIETPEGITASEKTCTIEFEVQKIVDRTFENVLVETRNVPSSKELILFPGRINVVLRGGINRLGKFTNDSIKAYVDYWSALREEHGTTEAVIEVPPFIIHTNTIPNKLEYIIKQ
ncbi:MAG: hypothetical protein WC061_08810 [Melioribacteraceae bacterium]